MAPPPSGRVSNAISGSAATAAPCGCAAHSAAERIIAAQPPLSTTAASSSSPRQPATARGWPGAATPARPLAGLKVLDLTRVLAGPVATRFLAGYGADVLRIDPPDWNEPGVIPEVTPGKRCARLDLRQPADRVIFEDLLARADVLVHGYRPAVLERLGYGEQFRRALNPGLVDVCLDAYGWSGPLAGRRGFDSLVQMSTGIAGHGMRMRGADKPVPLPVQALDHATGYLMAAAALRGLLYRLTDNRAMGARLSLARTAKLLTDTVAEEGASPLAAAGEADLSAVIEHTEWGMARRLVPPLVVPGAAMAWDSQAASLGSSPARFT